jgi:aryl-alcohol dehydrogenase-like predicted oxidoreductase
VGGKERDSGPIVYCYQGKLSEDWLPVVLKYNCSQYTSPFKQADPKVIQKINYVGNNAKSLYLSVEASLKKLRTSYIDLLYVHWWDWDTSVEEVMDALHILVQERKVLYLVRVKSSLFDNFELTRSTRVFPIRKCQGVVTKQ